MYAAAAAAAAAGYNAYPGISPQAIMCPRGELIRFPNPLTIASPALFEFLSVHIQSFVTPLLTIT